LKMFIHKYEKKRKNRKRHRVTQNYHEMKYFSDKSICIGYRVKN
jgi:hypothetical protein